jgi:glucosamine--fructose-6-phosphate aminotransferase (isomerizing)
VALLGAMACHLARERGRADPHAEAALRRLPSAMERVMERDGDCRRIAARLKEWEHVFFIGRGRDLDACHEGSLKLKEISYVHSEAYAAGELKHGTISLIDRGTPVLALITDRAMRDKTVANVKECRARGAYVILLVSADVGEVPADAYDRQILLPGGLGELSVLPAAAVFQRIAYETAVRLGRDVDKPRNLAKSVTVE